MEMDRSILSLKERLTELEDALSKLKTQDDQFDVDEAVVTTAPIYKQYVTSLVQTLKS